MCCLILCTYSQFSNYKATKKCPINHCSHIKLSRPHPQSSTSQREAQKVCTHISGDFKINLMCHNLGDFIAEPRAQIWGFSLNPLVFIDGGESFSSLPKPVIKQAFDIKTTTTTGELLFILQRFCTSNCTSYGCMNMQYIYENNAKWQNSGQMLWILLLHVDTSL